MSEFPRYRPVEQYVVDNLNLKKEQVYTSRLNAWIRVTSNAGEGLVLQSNPNRPLLGEDGSYGNASSPGVVGTTWGGNPVRVTTDDRGLRPSPIIEGISIKNGTMGLTRQCDFSIKAFTPGQVDVLQLYFGQPGFTSLVEFGWDLERSHNQKLELNTNNIASLQDFTKVLEKRKASNGDYGNFFGFITGFKVSSDGDIYKLDVTLKGLGEIPSTLKLHKHVEDDSSGAKVVTATSKKFFPNTMLKETDAGRLNFMYMFNELPGHKQIESIAKLIDDYGKEENFINFNEKTRSSIEDETEGQDVGKNKIDTDAGRVPIPKGTNLIGEERFIRFGLFKKIIDTNNLIDLADTIKVGNKTYPAKIYTDFTVCNAFDRIFSTRKDRLVIPNVNTPDFGFLKALAGQESDFAVGNNDCSQEIQDTDKINKSQTKVEFPRRTDLNEGTQNGFEGLVRSSGNWGYLDDLYINFDFAVSILEAENLTYADALLELCNGLSSAVNSVWEFQIIEKNAPFDAYDGKIKKGDLCLQIVEMNCTSEKKPSAQRFVHNGEGSFFINGTLDIDMPGEMMNSIIADRKAADGGKSIDVSPEGADAGGFPINKETIRDSVLDVLNENARKEVETQEGSADTSGTGPVTDVPDNEEDAIAAIYNAFLDKVGAYPSRKDGEFNLDDTFLQRNLDSGETVTVEEVLLFPTYNDQGLFKRFMTEDNPNLKSGTKQPKGAGVLIGMLKYNFTVHGNSGMVHGDTFNIIGIPSVYTDSGFFQITNVEHNIDQMIWTTNIEGTYRAGAN